MITCSKQGEPEGMKRQRKRRRRTQRRRARRVRRCCDLRASHMTKSKASLVWHLSVATAWSPARSRHRVLRSLVCDSVQYFALQCAGKATERKKERGIKRERTTRCMVSPVQSFRQAADSRQSESQASSSAASCLFLLLPLPLPLLPPAVVCKLIFLPWHLWPLPFAALTLTLNASVVISFLLTET